MYCGVHGGGGAILLKAPLHLHLLRCGIIHADIKPDNILISAGHNAVWRPDFLDREETVKR